MIHLVMLFRIFPPRLNGPLLWREQEGMGFAVEESCPHDLPGVVDGACQQQLPAGVRRDQAVEIEYTACAVPQDRVIQSVIGISDWVFE